MSCKSLSTSSRVAKLLFSKSQKVLSWNPILRILAVPEICRHPGCRSSRCWRQQSLDYPWLAPYASDIVQIRNTQDCLRVPDLFKDTTRRKMVGGLLGVTPEGTISAVLVLAGIKLGFKFIELDLR